MQSYQHLSVLEIIENKIKSDNHLNNKDALKIEVEFSKKIQLKERKKSSDIDDTEKKITLFLTTVNSTRKKCHACKS